MKTLGLELGSHLARVVVADVKRGRLQLLEAATLPLADDGPAAVADALAGFLGSADRGLRRFVVGLPPDRSLVKLVSFPATSEENLALLARAAAESALPLPPEQVRFDHAVVDPGEPGRSATVALAAARRDILEPLAAAVSQLGLPTPIFDVTALALANAFAAPVKSRGLPTALLELGEADVQLVFLDGAGRLRQVRILDPDPEALAEEVERACQQFARLVDQPLAEVKVVGSGAADAVAVLDEALSAPTTLGDVWATAAAENGFAGQGATYAVATGLALRGGDVPLAVDLKEVARPVQPVRQTSTSTALLAVLLVAVLAAGGWFWQAYNFRRTEARLARERLEAVERNLAALGGARPELTAAAIKVADRLAGDGDWLALLEALSARLPGGVALEEINLDRGRPVVLRGQAFTNALVAQTMDVLNGLERFTAVRLDYANAERIGEELVYNFQITCPWAGEAGGASR